ncbi:MAG TPA: WGxxGxxG family protein [Vicinamibacterales bacterium]|nr:WGxxGxxG family protein [Vicinamibacterales bacterium]
MRFKLSLLAMVAMLGVGYTTVAAQQQPQSDVRSIDARDDNRDNGFDMGWLGLIGLTGLLGMKRSSDVRTRTTVGDHTPSHVTR